MQLSVFSNEDEERVSRRSLNLRKNLKRLANKLKKLKNSLKDKLADCKQLYSAQGIINKKKNPKKKVSKIVHTKCFI
jgi:uncharacterized protein (DUF3084 family)